MALTGRCFSVASLVFLLQTFRSLAGFRGIYPPVTELSKFKSVQTSSTCGLNNVPMRYCVSSTSNQTVSTCTQFTCLFDCCTNCGKTKPPDLSMLTGTQTQITPSSDLRPGSVAGSRSSSFAPGSSVSYGSLAASNVPKSGLSVAAWVKQQTGTTGCLISKGSSYSFILKEYDIDFLYTTKDATSVRRNSTIRNLNLIKGRWQHISFVVYSRILSVFINGEVQRTIVLDGVINDVTQSARIGQMPDGSLQFVGLLQEVKYFSKGLTNREVVEAMNGTLPSVYGYSFCRCPTSHPRISLTSPLYCIENGVTSTDKPQSRLSENSHPPEYTVDGDVVKPWISQLVDNATIEIDLVYSKLQVFQVQIMFYGPPAKGIKIERSRDGGRTYTPWQYFADDCYRMFGLANNGPLTQPDSVNCLQITSPVRPDFETLSFQTQEAGPEKKPQRPIGQDGCTDFHCSPKLLEFVKATNVKISLYQHMLVTNPLHKYFGLRRVLVSGTCDCYGHGAACTTYASNSTHVASYFCSCDARTFTEGSQCQYCMPLYRDKPFKRGMVLDAYPCKKCECNNHAISCTYNSTLDADPNNRNTLGGGFCDSCQHNTMGRFCQTCRPNYYRPSGKALNSIDVCSACNCVGSGITVQNSDCQRDGSDPSIVAGQCSCKIYAAGRQCDKCKDGYYHLTAANPEGCVQCECNVAGILNGNITCHIATGQCNCKANVFRLKCSRCKPGFYGLSASKVEGCNSCSCDPWGSTEGRCNENTGQCSCKPSTTGLRCNQCKDGYHSLSSTGCQLCRCNIDGTDPARVNLCNNATGNCVCRANVEGASCDRCKIGFYNLSRIHSNGCLPCNCNSKGTIGNSGQCDFLNGTCACKSFVTGRECNTCKTGTFNLSASNSDGCTRCNCNPKGTVSGNTAPQTSLECFNDGQCKCLSNVIGLRCDQCRPGYYWNPSGQGCVPCNCNIQGSVNQACNASGHCNCIQSNGVGGSRCDRCLPGFFNFNAGRCTSCGCSVAGSLVPNCDSTGRCLQCKGNVQGVKCDQCKPGTSNMQVGNPFGCSGAPSEQGPPIISNITSRSLLASWFPPDTPNGLILRYELYRNSTVIYNGTNRAFRDTGLTPYTLFTYSITVHTAAGSTRSVDSEKVYQTLPDIPEGVGRPVLSNALARSIHASWSLPSSPNGIIIAYRLSSTNTRASSPVQHYSGPLLRFLVTGLRPFTVYNFTITACTLIGCAHGGFAIQATRSAAPDSQPAPYLTPLEGGQSIYVYWDPPAEPNGVVQFYDLFMRRSPSSDAGTTQGTKLNQAQRNFTVTGLRPYTDYEFRVVSYTSQVKGDTSSTWASTRTLENVPSGEEYISPRSRATSSTSVNLTWSEPRFPNGVLIRYEVYRYEVADLTKPILTTSALGTVRSALITGLSPYTNYQLSVRACNSKGCTGYSSRTAVQTIPDAPTGQPSPNVTSLNGSSVYLSWLQPTVLNGPLPVKYQYERLYASLHYPPPQVEAGIRFSSFGYYKLPSTIMPDSAETDIEFQVKTRFSEGLIFYASSKLQEDLAAIELRSGQPWFIFDTETGPAAFTVAGSIRIDDGSWHSIKATRQRRSGTIVVDGTHSGTGAGSGSANIIGQIATVYVGGLPRDFRILRRDSGNVVLRRTFFIGCIKNMKYKNADVNFNQAVSSVGVDPLYSHCPSDLTTGIHFKGGGYLTLPNGNFTGGSIFVIQVWLRTTYSSGLILFAHGKGSTSIALAMGNGNITLYFRTAALKGSESIRAPHICDGKWHNLTVTGFSSFSAIYFDGVVSSFGRVPSDAVVDSPVYLGGVPQGSQAMTLLRSLINHDNITFGGCMRNIAFSRTLRLQRDAVDSRNVAFDGCPADFTSELTIIPCVKPLVWKFETAQSRSAVDKGLRPFTDYLYRIKSYRDGVKGFAESKWIAIRTREGAPDGLSSPVISSFQARWTAVAWNPPTASGGLLTKYQIRATNSGNASIVMVADVTSTSVLTYNFTGLEPDTSYNISVAAFTSGGSTESKHVQITTKEAAPEQLQPPTAISYPHALFITWAPPLKPNGRILFYQLHVNSITISRFAGAELSYNATGLQVYTRYRVVLRAANAISLVSAATDIYTGQLPPQGVHAPQLRVLGSRRMEVTWRVPLVLNGVISKYEVLASPVDVLSQYTVAYTASSDTFNAVVGNMTPGALYYVRIAAWTGGGRAVSNVSTAKTFESAPEDVPAPLLDPVSSFAINVTIRLPLKPNGIIIRHELYQNGILIKNNTLLHFQSVGLLPHSLHSFRVRACTAKGCGESRPVSTYTLDAPPIGNVTLRAIATGPRKLEALWTAVQIPNGNMEYSLLVTGEAYVDTDALGSPISFQTRNVTRTVYNGSLVNSTFTFNGLLPHSSYQVQVNASNRAGFIMSNLIAFSTSQDAPEGIRLPSIIAINSTAVNVSWSRPGRANGIVLSYQLIGRFPMSRSSHRLIYFQTGLHFNQVIASLQPYTNYSFKVAVNGSGGSAESEWQNVTTPQDIPEHIDRPKIINVESRTVFVELSAPATPNGIIIHYILYLNNTEMNRTLRTNFEVRGLMPFTHYSAYVECCTIIGCKASARTVVFQTLQDVPSGLSAPTLVANGSRSVVITWARPSITNGIVLSYQIQRKLQGQLHPALVGTVNATSSANIFVDRTVKPWRTYLFRVIARTIVGGTPGPYSSVKMPEGDPEGIAPPNVTVLSSSQFDISWMPPSGPNGVVTHYYVKTTGRKELVNRTTDLSFTLTGLGSYISYPIIITACTIGGCGDSPPTTKRSLPSPPSGQPSPAAEVLSATSLRIRWDLPHYPNGPITQFLLQRRTMEDLISGRTGTLYPTNWVMIYRGSGQSHDDSSLGVYSLQQYMVTTVTTMGNTSSNSSSSFRTGAAAPLQGVNLTASPIDHATAKLSWTLPPIALLRGPAIRFDITFEIVGGPVFVSKSLPGNETSTVIDGLKPRTRYAFKVLLYNGAGSADSQKAVIQTLDGSPEGLDPPSLSGVSSTSIRVMWSAPRVPNGKISNYTIFANTQAYDTVSGSTFSHVQGKLKPYTWYTIQVRACTLYSCTRSRGSSARTLEAAPGLINPPFLQTLSSSSIRVQWALPVEPNGPVSGYRLHRRKVYICPTTPKPVTKCTYVECGISQQVCNGRCYHPGRQVCCNGSLHQLVGTKSCCGNKYIRKNTENDVCCGGKFYLKQANYQCCHGQYLHVPSGSVCCQGNTGVVVGLGNSCCGDVPYDINGGKSCICGALYTGNRAIRKCCGGRVVSIAQQCCGNDTVGKAYDFDASKVCCGVSYVHENTSLCCKDSVGKFKVHNHSSLAQKTRVKCCGLNQIVVESSCCNNRSYDNVTQVCADRSSFGETDCGNGQVCMMDQRSTAYCNRCNFNPTTSFCGSVNGYFHRSTSAANESAEFCYTNYTLALNIPSSPSVLLYDDVGLLPHTLYDYYVTVINRQGSSNSLPNRTRTLMATPEGLARPQVTVLTATMVVITWSAPTNPNGVIQNYKLYRTKWSTKENILVFSGLSFSHTDSQGLEPNTGYMYVLSACTVLCSNISAATLVYTKQAAPANVMPPILTPLSASSIQVNWTLPGRPNGNILRYKVSQLVNGTFVSILPTGVLGLAMTQTVTGLMPYTQYTFRVGACTLPGCSDGPPASIRTLQAPPEGLDAPILTIVNSRTIEVQWRPPRTINGILLRYNLHRNSKPVYSGLHLQFRDILLTPNIAYSYSVEAVTSGGGTRSRLATIRTPESTPEGIARPTVSATSSSQLGVGWQPPSQPNGVITNYSLIYNEPNSDIFTKPMKLSLTGTIASLKPFTLYEVRIQACTVKGCGTGNRTTSRTLEAAPLSQPPPVLAVRSSSIIEISWVPPTIPNGIIKRYLVTRRKLNETITYVVFLGSTLSYIDTLLEPYTYYQYRVRAHNSVGSVDSQWRTGRTLSGAPQGLSPPVIQIIDGVSAQVSWQPPSSPNGLITEYQVKVRVTGTSTELTARCCIPAGIRNVTVVGLKPATAYDIRVAALTSGGTGFSGWSYGSTLEARPANLSRLRSNKNADGSGDGRSLQVLWSPPANPNGVITNYRLYLGNYVVYEGLNLQAMVRRLQPFTNYTFTLEACNSAGCTKGDPQVLVTADVAPQGQMPPSLGAVTATSVTLHWRAPLSPNGAILRYEVLRRISATRRKRRASEAVIYSTNDTNKAAFTYTDSNLSPYTTYQYKIRAVNSRGQIDSDWFTIQTASAAPAGVFAPNATALDGYSVRLNWAVPSVPNGQILYFEVYRNGSRIPTSSALIYTDTKLSPATMYQYSIRACTAGGCTMSGTVSVKTHSSAPGDMRPPALTPLDANRMRASWTMPAIPNGLIQKYQLRLSNNEQPVFEGLANVYIVSGLSPYTVYSLTITSCTSSGCGTRSTPASARTLEAPPQDLAAPSLFVLGPTTIEATWSPPSTPNGIIRHYTLSRDSTVVYNGTDMRFYDRTVAPGTRYLYTISCTNGAGSVTSAGQYSDTTTASAPENVSMPILRPLSSSSIEVTWVAPKKPNGAITRYYVLIGAREVNAGIKLHYVALNLQYYTLYQFRIGACTSAGCTSGPSASARTLEASPANQSAPIFNSANIGSRYVFVEWLPPLNPNGIIRHYELHRRSRSIPAKAIYTGPSRFYNDSSSDIQPNSRYEYQVIATNGVGSTPSVWAPITTTIAKPEQVQQVSVLPGDIRANSFLFTVEEPGKPNGMILSYIVEVIGLRNITLTAVKRGTASGLESYTEYSVRMYACNAAGCARGPLRIIRTSPSVPSGFGNAPGVVAKSSRTVNLTWTSPAKLNGPSVWYQVQLRYTCPQDSIPPSLCKAGSQYISVGNKTRYTVTGLRPYVKYHLNITVYNTAGFVASPEVIVTTNPENPVALLPPNVTIVGISITIDWTRSFDLRSPLEEYSLEENLIQAYTGNKLVVTRPNREVGAYSYIVKAKTLVNRKEVTIAAPAVTVTIGDVAPTSVPATERLKWYQKGWVLALLGLATALLLLICIGLVLRRFSGGLNVYVRESTPLPRRSKSKMGTQASTRSSDAISERRLPYIGTPAQSRHEMFQMTPNLYSSHKELLGDTTGIDYTPPEDNLSFLYSGDPKGFSSNGKDHDSGLYDDPSPTLQEDYDSVPYQSIQKERILFPDTHL